MTRETFERTYGDRWTRLERMLDRLEPARRSPKTVVSTSQLDAYDPAAFDGLYRSVCKHLVLARQRLYGQDLTDYLNALALRAHRRLYARRQGPWAGLLKFAVSGFPAAVRSQATSLVASAILFLGPCLALGIAVYQEPKLIYSIHAPEQIRQFEEMYDPAYDYRSRERQSDGDVAMFGFYIWNNISVAFRTFGGGILLGLGSVFFLVFNGLAIGSVAGYLTQLGMGKTFYPFVSGHSAFELTALVLAGAAGLSIGWSIVAPGQRRRSVALKLAALTSARVIGGATLMLVAAAFVEAFWSSSLDMPDGLKYGVGLALWVLTLAYLGLAGRGRGA